MKILSAPLVLNITFSVIELIIAGAEVSHFGGTAVVWVILLEFVKTIITSGLVILFWNAGLRISAYMLALLPFILLIPLLILLLSSGARFSNMINQ
jgi:hypothetical protein